MEMCDQLQAPRRFTPVPGSKVGPNTGLDFGKEKYFLPLPVIETRFFTQQRHILLVVLSTLLLLETNIRK